VNEPCIRLTQENSIENSVQKCLPYILNNDGLYYYLSVKNEKCGLSFFLFSFLFYFILF